MSAPLQTRRTSRVPRKKRFDDNWVVDQVISTGESARSPSAMSTSSSVQDGSVSVSSLSHSQHFPEESLQPLSTPPVTDVPMSAGSSASKSAFVMPHRASTTSIASIESSHSKSAGKQSRNKLSIALTGGGTACVTRAQARRKGNQSDMKAISAMSRWKPEDDYLLLRSILHLRDIATVHKAVKFTCMFSPADLTERWRALLYNPCVSHVARLGVNNLPVWRKNQLNRRVAFSEAEESELYLITAKEVFPNQSASGLGKPCLRPFEKILTTENGKFFPCRTPLSLFHHWSLLRRHDLIIKEEPTEEAMAQEFEYVEDLIQHEAGAPASEAELMAMRWLNRRRLRSIRRHEEEAKRWGSLAQMAVYKSVDSLDADNFQFDAKTLAVLVGSASQLPIRSTSVLLGRRTGGDTEETLDLSEEGPARRIAIHHCRVDYCEDKQEFRLKQLGRQPVFVNGLPVLTGFHTPLPDQATLVADHLAFIFFINPNLFEVLDTLKSESE